MSDHLENQMRMDAQRPRPCPRCGGVMRPGKALANTANYGTPDFAGMTDHEGQTFSYTGPAVMVEVMKCEACGHSRGEGWK